MADNNGGAGENSIEIRTRFAPSPTGLLHIGGARTALFNYLWAKRGGGAFLLRFEDTDRERSSPVYASAILRDLRWLGIVPDGEPLCQTSRFARHMEVLNELAARGAAYPCFCPADGHTGGTAGVYAGTCRDIPPEEAARRIAAGERHCWRLAVPRHVSRHVFRDRLRGELSLPSESIGDFVLTRADGSCTYLFAVVADDHDTGVTHVIRGEEHLSNTPRQEMIYRALGWTPPEWVHISMILDEARHKLSKRSGAISLASYREEGWEPEAITAYLATLSWAGAPTDRLASLAELAERFSLDDVALSSPIHDPERLRHFGKLALAETSPEALLAAVHTHFPGGGEEEPLPPSASADRLEMIAELLPLCATRRELAAALDGLFDAADARREADIPRWLSALREALASQSLGAWSHAGIKGLLRAFMKERALKGKDFYHTLRRILTGREDGVPVALLIACLGKKLTLDKIFLHEDMNF